MAISNVNNGIDLLSSITSKSTSGVSSYSYDNLQNVSTAASSAVATASDDNQVLDQEDFLKLLTTQLANQDPSEPVDNNQMVSTMAQLSVVEGLNTVNSNMQGVIDAVSSSSALSASSLVGRSVLVDSKKGFFDGYNPMSAKIDAGDGYTDIKIQVKDSNGKVVAEYTAPSGSGYMSFSWDGVNYPDNSGGEGSGGEGSGETGDGSTDGSENTKLTKTGETDGSSGTDNGTNTGDGEGDGNTDGDQQVSMYPAGMYTIEATGVNSQGKTVSLPVSMYATVSSVTLGKTFADTVLSVVGFGDISLSDVKEISI